MKRVLTVFALVAILAIAVDQLGDLTQSRPDPIRRGEVTEVVVKVKQDRFATGTDGAARALWGVCGALTSSIPLSAEGLASTGDPDTYRVVLAPAIGRTAKLKLVGCLEDLTIDRVFADVETVRTFSITGF